MASPFLFEIKLKDFQRNVKVCKDFGKFSADMEAWIVEHPGKNLRIAEQALQTASEAAKLENSENCNVRHAANKVLDSLNHDVSQFIHSTKKYHDVLMNENLNRLQIPEVKPINLCNGYYLLPPNSPKELHKFGHSIFKNCLRRRETADEYFSRMKSGEIELYILHNSTDFPVALMELEVCERKIKEFDIAYDSTTEEYYFIPYRVFAELVRQLEISGDTHGEFLKHGVVMKFLDEVPAAERIQLHDGRGMYIYIYKNEFITVIEPQLKSDDTRVSNFSLVESRGYPEWSENPGSSTTVGELLWLMQRNPKLNRKLSEFNQQNFSE